MPDKPKEPAFLLKHLSGPAKVRLQEAFAAQNASGCLILTKEAARGRVAHGELVTGTVLVVAAKLAVPIFAGWLVSLAPPRKRKETISMVTPDGTTVTKTIEYSKSTSITDLISMLGKVFDLKLDE